MLVTKQYLLSLKDIISNKIKIIIGFIRF